MKRFFRLEVLNVALIVVGLLFGVYELGFTNGKRMAEKAYVEEWANWSPTPGSISITSETGEDPCLWFYTGKDWWSPMERCKDAAQPKW